MDIRWWFIYLLFNQIGNAAINDETDTMGMVEYAWSHGIISDQLHSNIFKECNFSLDIENLTLSCLNHYRDFLVSYSKIDIYNIYAPICLYASSSSSLDSSVFRLLGSAPQIFSKYVSWYFIFSLEKLKFEIELLLLVSLTHLIGWFLLRNYGVSYQGGMIHVVQIMQKSTLVEKMFKGLFMLMLPNFLILTPLAGTYFYVTSFCFNFYIYCKFSVQNWTYETNKFANSYNPPSLNFIKH